MPVAWIDNPRDLGLDPAGWNSLTSRLEAWCERDEIPAITLTFGNAHAALTPLCLGRRDPRLSDPITPNTLFSVASITKPIVAMTAMRLLEEGFLTLGEKVTHILPEFRGAGRQNIRVSQLLSHTSGLPDLTPNDRELREQNAPLSEFYAAACRADLLFPPGDSVRYSSCGFSVLAEVLARVSGESLPQLVKNFLLDPLEMRRTALGVPSEWLTSSEMAFAHIRVPPDQEEGDSWNWNSTYWRTLGAPWGGLVSTLADLTAFAQLMLNKGLNSGKPILSPASVKLSTSSQLEAESDLAEAHRRTRPWGLGWKLRGPAQTAYFGDFTSPETYGHWGATGTLLWIDPRHNCFVVILSTQPQDPLGFYLSRVSNMIMASIRPS